MFAHISQLFETLLAIIYLNLVLMYVPRPGELSKRKTDASKRCADLGANFMYFFFLSMPFNIMGGCAHGRTGSLSVSLPHPLPPLRWQAGRLAGLT